MAEETINAEGSEKQTHYEILGVENNASSQEIRKAYLKKSKTVHPDKGGDEEKWIKVNQAYQVLYDEASRKKYDEKIEQELQSFGNENVNENQAEENEQEPSSPEPVSQLMTTKSIIEALQSRLEKTHLLKRFTSTYGMKFNAEEGVVEFKNSKQFGALAENLAHIVKQEGHDKMNLDVNIKDLDKVDEYAKAAFAGAAKSGIKPEDVKLTINGKEVLPSAYPKEVNKWDKTVQKVNSSKVAPAAVSGQKNTKDALAKDKQQAKPPENIANKAKAKLITVPKKPMLKIEDIKRSSPDSQPQLQQEQSQGPNRPRG